MPEEIKDESPVVDTTIVDTTKEVKGTLRVGIAGFNNPTPSLLARATKALRYFSVSLITMVSATDLFSGGQAKVICFCLGVFVLVTGAVDLFIGIEPEDKK